MKRLQILQKDFQYFFKHAIDHLLRKNTDYNKTMYVFSIQQSLELLVKLYLTSKYGVITILDNNQIKDKFGKIIPEPTLLKLLNNRKLKTKNYNELLKVVEQDVDLSKFEKDKLVYFQTMRNQIVHMGINNFSSSIASDVNLLIASIFNKLEYKENSSQYNDMENTLQNLLGA